MFNLEKYIVIGDKIKIKTSATEKDSIKLQGELKSVEDFIESTSIPSKKTTVVEGIKALFALFIWLKKYRYVVKFIDNSKFYYSITRNDNILC
jgi:hypothetical protein